MPPQSTPSNGDITPSQDEILAQLKSETARAGVPFDLSRRIMQAESGLNPNVGMSEKGAIGLMQVKPETAGKYGLDPDDWRQNIRAGVLYLKEQLDYFHGNQALAAGAYNAGDSAAREYCRTIKEIPPFKATIPYVNQVVPGYIPWYMRSHPNADAPRQSPLDPTTALSARSGASAYFPSQPNPQALLSGLGNLPPVRPLLTVPSPGPLLGTGIPPLPSAKYLAKP
jgi:hypothetical protein